MLDVSVELAAPCEEEEPTDIDKLPGYCELDSTELMAPEALEGFQTIDDDCASAVTEADCEVEGSLLELE